MGSLSASGTKLVQPYNDIYFSQNSNFIRKSNTDTKLTTTVANSGTVRGSGLMVLGTMFWPNGTATVSTSGLTERQRLVNITSVNWALFTDTGTASGVLIQNVTRGQGTNDTISLRAASGSLGPMITQTKRRVFWLDFDRNNPDSPSAWKLYDANGNYVGTAAGTTDTDITPTGIYGI